MCCLVSKSNSKINIWWYLASTTYSNLTQSTFTVHCGTLSKYVLCSVQWENSLKADSLDHPLAGRVQHLRVYAGGGDAPARSQGSAQGLAPVRSQGGVFALLRGWTAGQGMFGPFWTNQDFLSKGSDQWKERGFGSSPKHKMLVRGLVLNVFWHLNGLPSCMKLILPRVKQKRILFAANNSLCCECHVAPPRWWPHQRTKKCLSPHPHTKYLMLMLLQIILISRWSLPLKGR
jgi:hypothetical protein